MIAAQTSGRSCLDRSSGRWSGGDMGNLEQLARLRSGVDSWNAWRNENPGLRPDLSGADLRFCVLERVDLRQANLAGADFTHAFLYEADLCGAELSAATMVGTNLCLARLRDARLGHADLHRANLDRADLTGADLSGANLERTLLVGTIVSGARFSQCRATNTAAVACGTIKPRCRPAHPPLCRAW